MKHLYVYITSMCYYAQTEKNIKNIYSCIIWKYIYLYRIEYIYKSHVTICKLINELL